MITFTKKVYKGYGGILLLQLCNHIPLQTRQKQIDGFRREILAITPLGFNNIQGKPVVKQFCIIAT